MIPFMAQPAVPRIHRQPRLNLNFFVQEGFEPKSNLKFVLTGDFNDFEFSKGRLKHWRIELINLMQEHGAADGCSLFTRQQSSWTIFHFEEPQDSLAPVHINTFSGTNFRPWSVVVQLDFSKGCLQLMSESSQSPINWTILLLSPVERGSVSGNHSIVNPNRRSGCWQQEGTPPDRPWQWLTVLGLMFALLKKRSRN